jgi:peptidoglycan hydrolase-like protein with peptidoglycan-binding domain
LALATIWGIQFAPPFPYSALMLTYPLRASGLAMLAALLFCAGLATAAPAFAQEDPASLKEAQNILLMLGADIGKPDGQPGQKTVKALSDFQKQAGLPVTGKLDGKTMEALRGKREGFAGSLGGPRDKQPGGRASQRNQVESKPQAAGPAGDVDAQSLAVPTLPGQKAPLPPASLGSASGEPGQRRPVQSYASPGGPPVEEPGFEISDWLWIIPMLGIPIFLVVLWGGLRKPIPPLGAPGSAAANLARREPGFEGAQPEMAGTGRREPKL